MHSESATKRARAMKNVICINMNIYQTLVYKLEEAHEELCDAIVTRIPISNDHIRETNPVVKNNYDTARNKYEDLFKELEYQKKKLMFIESNIS